MIDVAETQPRGVDRFATQRRTPPPNLDALSRDILALKKKLNAVILAHNYQVAEIQDLADFVGDSLGLSQQAAKTPASVIVFCTSGNAVKIVNAAPKNKDLLFVPDENLGSWVMEQTKRPMTLWRGSCYVHVEFTHASITRIGREYPGAPLVAHP